MDSIDTRISARDVALGRLNELTTWIALGAVAALGIFAAIAAETIPGKAPSSPSASSSSTSASTPFFSRHHDDSSTISSSSGPAIVVTGGSR